MGAGRSSASPKMYILREVSSRQIPRRVLLSDEVGLGKTIEDLFNYPADASDWPSRASIDSCA